MRNLTLLVLAMLLAACAAAPPAGPTVSAPTDAALGPTAEGLSPAETQPPVTPGGSNATATAAPPLPTLAAATPTPPLPSALIGPETAGSLLQLRAVGLGYPYGAAFTADGAQLVVGTSAGLAWLRLPELELERLDPVGGVFELVVSPDGGLIAHGISGDSSKERSVLRRAADGALVAELEGAAPTFSPDGSTLATGVRAYAEPSKAWLWRASDGTRVAELAGGEPRFSPDGRFVATVERAYEAASTTRIYATDGSGPPLELEGAAPAFSPDGASVAVAQATQVVLYELPDGAPGATVPTGVEALPAFSDDGATLLIVDGADLIVWDLAAGAELRRLPNVNRAEEVFPPQEPRFARDGSAMASFELSLGDCPPAGVRLSATSDGRVIYEDDSSYSAAFSPDGSRAAMLPDLGVRVVDLASGASNERIMVGYEAAAFSPSGATLAASTITKDADSRLLGRVELWDIVTGELRATLESDPTNFVYSLSAMRFSPDGARLTALARYGCVAIGFNKLLTWDIATAALIGTGVEIPSLIDESEVPTDSATNAVAFVGDGSVAAWRSEAGTPILWREGVGELELAATELPTAMAFTSDAQLLAVGDETGGVTIYSVADGSVGASFQAGAELRELRYSDDGALLVGLRFDDTVVAWGTDGAELARFAAGADSAGLSLSADKAVLALIEPGGVALYGLEGGALLGRVEGAASDAALGPGRRLLASVRDGRVLLWGAP